MIPIARYACLLLIASGCAPATRMAAADRCPVPPARAAVVVDTVADDDGEIVGAVTSSTEGPRAIGFAAWLILANSSERIPSTEQSDQFRFRFRGIPPGRHELLIYAVDFYPRRVFIDVPAHGGLRLGVPLDRSPSHWCEEPIEVPRS